MARLGEEGQDGDAGVAAHHRHVHLGHVQARLLGVEGLGAHLWREGKGSAGWADGTMWFPHGGEGTSGCAPGAASGTHHVQRGHAQHALLVVHAQALERLGRDGHRGVDGVGDDVEQGLRAQGVPCERAQRA